MNSSSSDIHITQSLVDDKDKDSIYLEQNPQNATLSFLPNVLGIKSINSESSDMNKSTITIRMNMVNEILRILDKTLIFTVIFILIDLIKMVLSCLVLYFLDQSLIDRQPCICLILFVIQNILETAYLMSKLIQTILKQKTVLNMYLKGKEIIFNPYEANSKEKLLEYLYFSIMTFYAGLFLWGNIVFWQNQDRDDDSMTYIFAMILIELLIGYFYAFIFGLFLLGLLFCAPLLVVSYIYKKLNQRRNAKKIDNLPIIKYEQKTFQEIECSICIEPYNENDNIIQLSCKHYFHEKCIKPWLAISEMCPFCRGTVLK